MADAAASASRPSGRARRLPQALRARQRGARRADRWARVEPAPRPTPAPIPRQLTYQQLGEAIASCEARAHMKRPAPKSDALQNAWKVYGKLHQFGRAGGSGAWDSTYAQLLKAIGYAGDHDAGVRSLKRWLRLLADAGLVRVEGVKDSAGRWQRLDVELLPLAEDPEHPAECDPGAAEARARLIAAGLPAWAVHRLSRRERRLLAELCPGATVGRLPRQVARRITRKANLPTPERSPFSYGKGLARGAVRERAHARGPAADQGRRDRAASRAPLTAATPPAAAPGLPRPAAAGTAQVAGVPAAPTVEASLVRAVARAGYRDGLLPAAVAAAAEGADPAEVVLAAWRAVHGAAYGEQLHTERRRQLDVALRRLDRYALFGAGQPGAGVHLAVERILADVEADAGEVGFHRVGGLICWLRSEAASWRRSARVRAGELPPRRRGGQTGAEPPKRGGPWRWPREW